MEKDPEGYIGNWLTKKYLNWQLENGQRASVRKFSAWLGFENHNVVAQLMNNQARPGPKSIPLIGRRFPEIWEMTGAERPVLDYRLEDVIKELPPERKEAFLLELDELIIGLLRAYGMTVEDFPDAGDDQR